MNAECVQMLVNHQRITFAYSLNINACSTRSHLVNRLEAFLLKQEIDQLISFRMERHLSEEI
jgi:hypothetical protein